MCHKQPMKNAFLLCRTKYVIKHVFNLYWRFLQHIPKLSLLHNISVSKKYWSLPQTTKNSQPMIAVFLVVTTVEPNCWIQEWHSCSNDEETSKHWAIPNPGKWCYQQTRWCRYCHIHRIHIQHQQIMQDWIPGNNKPQNVS